jgi:hypothetical protein
MSVAPATKVAALSLRVTDSHNAHRVVMNYQELAWLTTLTEGPIMSPVSPARRAPPS